MTKRIIALVSILLMVVNTCASAVTINKDYNMLYNFGVVGETQDVYENKRSITQREFITALVGLTTEEEIPEDSILEYAQSLNIISNIDSKEFESAISYERALNLTLNTLGYAKVIQYSGNNVEAVRQYASECNLMKGVSLNFGDNLDGKSMITILSNALEANMINAVLSDKQGSFEKSDKNPLEAYRGIEEITGKITHTKYTSLYGEKGVDKNQIGIDDVIYDIGYDYDLELLGQTVKAYVREDVVFHIEPKGTNIKKIEIEGKDIVSVSGDFTKLEYKGERKIEDIDLTPALTVIYNGRNYTGYTKEDLMSVNGKIVCLDFDRDKKYDIVHVYDYETIVVKNVSTLYKKIDNVYNIPGRTKTFNLDEDYTDFKIYKNGQEIGLASVEVNDILSVLKSKGDEPILLIYVGNEKIKGKVNRFDRTENIVKINDVEYEVNKDYLSETSLEGTKVDALSHGKEFELYLDYFGKIAYAKQDRLEGYEYVLIFKQRWIDTTAKVRILNINDEWEDLYYAEKVKLNDSNKLDADVVFDLMGGKELVPKIVLMKRDAEGKIAAIREADVSNEYGAKGFVKTSPQDRYYWTGDSSFNCRHYLKYDAIVLLKPTSNEDKFDEELYEFATVGYFSDWGRYKYVAYNVDEFGYADLLEVEDNRKVTEVTLYINGMVQTLNEYGEPAKLVTGNINGIENLGLFEIPGSNIPDVEVGDIAEVSLRNGKISQLNVIYSIGEDKEYKVPADSSDIHGGGKEVFGDVVGIDQERAMLLVDCDSEIIPIFVPSEAEIEVFDSNADMDKRKYVIGSLNDIYEGNYVRIIMSSNQVRSVVVIQ